MVESQNRGVNYQLWVTMLVQHSWQFVKCCYCERCLFQRLSPTHCTPTADMHERATLHYLNESLLCGIAEGVRCGVILGIVVSTTNCGRWGSLT